MTELHAAWLSRYHTTGYMIYIQLISVKKDHYSWGLFDSSLLQVQVHMSYDMSHGVTWSVSHEPVKGMMSTWFWTYISAFGREAANAQDYVWWQSFSWFELSSSNQLCSIFGWNTTTTLEATDSKFSKICKLKHFPFFYM